MADEPSQHVGTWQVGVEVAKLILVIVLAPYYSFSYSKIPPNLRDDILAKCFFAYIVLEWAYVGVNMIDTYYVVMNYGKILTIAKYHGLNPLNRFPFNLLKIVNLGRIGIGIYLIGQISPYSGHCAEMSEYYHPCISLQLITIEELLYIHFYVIIGIIMFSEKIGKCLFNNETKDSSIRTKYNKTYGSINSPFPNFDQNNPVDSINLLIDREIDLETNENQ
jgi:hypothetical protein